MNQTRRHLHPVPTGPEAVEPQPRRTTAELSYLRGSADVGAVVPTKAELQRISRNLPPQDGQAPETVRALVGQRGATLAIWRTNMIETLTAGNAVDPVGAWCQYEVLVTGNAPTKQAIENLEVALRNAVNVEGFADSDTYGSQRQSLSERLAHTGVLSGSSEVSVTMVTSVPAGYISQPGTAPVTPEVFGLSWD